MLFRSMFLLASQLSTRVLDTGRELIDHELSPRLHQKIGFRSPTPKRAWSLDSLNSAASRALNQLFSSATEHLKHALRRLEGDALTSAVPWKLGLPPLYMGTFQSDLRVSPADCAHSANLCTWPIHPTLWTERCTSSKSLTDVCSLPVSSPCLLVACGCKVCIRNPWQGFREHHSAFVRYVWSPAELASLFWMVASLLLCSDRTTLQAMRRSRERSQSTSF